MASKKRSRLSGLFNCVWFCRLSSGLARAWPVFLVAFVAFVPSLEVEAASPTKFKRWPYVQNTTDNSTVICWEADAAHAGTVAYGTFDSYESWQFTQREQNAQCVTLTDLSSYTRYYFRVSLSGTQLISIGSFVTLSPNPQQPISFVAWGDHRTNREVHRDLALKVMASSPDLVIDLGDLVDNGFEPGNWDIFFGAEQELLASTSVFPVIGNHELNSPLYFGSFVLPGNERWYSFDSGPVHFAGLDVVFSAFGPGSEQYAWLEQDLAGTMRPWKVVWMHYPPYDYSSHPSDASLKRDLAPLFEKYGVQLVFAGHTHQYQRNVVNGVNYVITGGGGAPLVEIGKGPLTAYVESVYHYVKVDATPDKLTIIPIRGDGSQFDVFSLASSTVSAAPEVSSYVVSKVSAPLVPLAAKAPAIILSNSSASMAFAGLAFVGLGVGLTWLFFKREKRR